VSTSKVTRAHALVAVLILLAGTLVSIAGTDLVLPAIPSLPASLGGTEVTAQFVTAAFVAGLALGLLVAGELGGKVDARRLLSISMLIYGLASLLAASATSIETLIPLRFVQGAFGAAPAVYAPGFIRRIFDEAQAIRVLGAFGSIESLVPGLAPIAGAWLLAEFGWRSSFLVVAAISIPVAAVLALAPDVLPPIAKTTPGGSYLTLLTNPRYMRYSFSQSLTLGAILVFVFGAPSVITTTMGGTLKSFVLMQATGVGFYIIGANVTGAIATRWGSERLIVAGTWMSAAGLAALLLYAAAGGNDPVLITVPWALANIGFGLRSPTGFYATLKAAHGNEARGAALIFLGFLAISAIGTALVAPFITSGLLPLSLGAFVFSAGSVVCLIALPARDEEPM
jgi:predicted MFS family arabinose efflux permease